MKEEVKIMNRKTFELDENETCMSLEDYTLSEKILIIKGLYYLITTNGVLEKCTPICETKTGIPVAMVLEWKYNRDIMKNLFDINKIVNDSIREVYEITKKRRDLYN